MKFSIRDLLLVTVIVALAVGWWVDRSRLTGEIRDYEIIEMPNPSGVSGPGQSVKEWRQERKEWKEWEERLQRELSAMTPAQRGQKVRELFGSLPSSQTPAPNPPKP
ncbi:MAG: hypothetical protein IAF94_15755 [Pirellulaceae bacterium]|nr:hypothetical protein [Pirellulaceae bacterium]